MLHCDQQASSILDCTGTGIGEVSLPGLSGPVAEQTKLAQPTLLQQIAGDDVIGDYCQRHQLLYRRFMDDWVFFCRTRGQLKTLIKKMNQVLARLKLVKHPDKTFIGRIKSQGIDFLGYQINGNQLHCAAKTIANYRQLSPTIAKITPAL